MRKGVLRKRWVFLVALVILAGCGTSMVTLPPVEPGGEAFCVSGRIQYDGNRAYLPATIEDCGGRAAAECDLLFRYSYQVAYGKDNVPELLPLFNPLTVVGFPVNEDTLVVHGHLEVFRGEEMLKSYEATSALERHSSIFMPGDTFTELRRKGLDAVKHSIENQMVADRYYYAESPGLAGEGVETQLTEEGNDER